MGAQVTLDPARGLRDDGSDTWRLLAAALAALALHAAFIGLLAIEWPDQPADPKDKTFLVELIPDEPRSDAAEVPEQQSVLQSGGDPDLAPGTPEPTALPEVPSAAEAAQSMQPPSVSNEAAAPEPAAVPPMPARKPPAREKASGPAQRTAAAATEGQGGGDRYLNLIRDRILSKRDYPAVANPLQLSGVALFELTIDRSGTLLNLRLVRTSGVGTLDEVGTDMVRRAAPFPPVPDHIGGERVRLSLTLALGPG